MLKFTILNSNNNNLKTSKKKFAIENKNDIL